MPAKAKDLSVKDSFDPRQNLDGGIRHVSYLLKKYEGDVKNRGFIEELKFLLEKDIYERGVQEGKKLCIDEAYNRGWNDCYEMKSDKAKKLKINGKN